MVGSEKGGFYGKEWLPNFEFNHSPILTPYILQMNHLLFTS